MDVESFSKWFAPLTKSERVEALAVIYSDLTVRTRQLFFPEWQGKEARVLEMLRGINEIHHTLSNVLLAYAAGREYPHSLEGLGRILLDNAARYRAEEFLESAVEWVKTKVPPQKNPS